MKISLVNIIDFMLEKGCEDSTNDFINRICNEGFRENVPIELQHHLENWAKGEPGEVCAFYFKKAAEFVGIELSEN